jgi:hypothetical protein
LQPDYADCWKGLEKKFAPVRERRLQID